MKTGLTNIDVYVLARELAYRRLEKMGRFEVGYKIKARPGADLLIIGNLLVPTMYTIPSQTPDAICMLFKKYLAGARVIKIEQINFDRVLKIDTERGSVVLELFGKGNIVLTDTEGKIITAKECRTWSARKILPGEKYTPPPPPLISPQITFEEFSNIFTKKDVVRSLVSSGLPPAYAEEVCLSAGINKTTPIKDLTPKDIESLYERFLELVEAIQHPKPTVYFTEGGEIHDITPVPLQVYAGYIHKRYGSLSEALDLLTPHILSVDKQDEEEKKRERIRSSILAEIQRTKQEIAALDALISTAYEYAADLMSQMNAAKEGIEPQSVGPFKLKSWNRRELVYEFTPPP